MIVRINDLEELMDRNASWGSPSSYCDQYMVLAIRIRHRKKEYLVINHNMLWWWDADLLDVIDESIPTNWITVQYKWYHKFRNKKYDFAISTSFYQGPPDFLQNEDFFFDIIENFGKAYRFCCEVVCKK